LIVEGGELRARFPEGINEAIGKGMALSAEEHEGSGFQWFDKSRGVSNRDDIADPRALITTATEGDDSHIAYKGVLSAKFSLGFLV
jgi:hypothetical protein